MPQNRNKLIELFIGNISNSITHQILEKAATHEELSNKYHKELFISFGIAKKYREKINPVNIPLPNKDLTYIKNKIIKNVRNELLTRISKGYQNLDLNLVEELVNKFLRKTNIL